MTFKYTNVNVISIIPKNIDIPIYRKFQYRVIGIYKKTIIICISIYHNSLRSAPKSPENFLLHPLLTIPTFSPWKTCFPPPPSIPLLRVGCSTNDSHTSPTKGSFAVWRGRTFF
jgi:hypothetical protein